MEHTVRLLEKLVGRTLSQGHKAILGCSQVEIWGAFDNFRDTSPSRLVEGLVQGKDAV